jgi:hypothetical protein
VPHSIAAAGSNRPTALADAKSRAIFTVVLRPEPRCADPVRALRHALKALLRVYGLRCTAVSEARPDKAQYDAQDDLAESIKLGFETVRQRVRSGGKGWP